MTPPIYQQLLNVLHVHLSLKDTKRLKPHLSSWPRLNELFLLGGLSPDDLRKLILIEVQGKQRRQILDKLVSRLKSAERVQLRELINQCIAP